MAASLEAPKKDESTWRLWTYVVALVKAVNPLCNMQVTITDQAGQQVPGATGEFMYAEGNVMLNLKGLGGGGGGKLETVTGAVNGVPATLKVSTDGKGWIAI